MHDVRNARRIRWLTYAMFLMFAMTSDAVGSVIPQVIAEFRLSMTSAGAFHYVPMAAIALGALLLGFLADRWGRKRTLIAGLCVYGVSCALFAVGNAFGYFVALLAMSGAGISIFKIGALALIGDISPNTQEHTRTMNLVEGFFGIGAILGPAIVAYLIGARLPWKFLYLLAAAMCAALIVLALRVRYPEIRSASQPPSVERRAPLRESFALMSDPYALGFSLLIMLYVATEVAIYVWMPTWLQEYRGDRRWLVAYGLTVFFVLRALGRFAGSWLLGRFDWKAILLGFAVAIFACFAGSLAGGTAIAVYLLPLSGLFMSMMYPTLNSKGISGYAPAQHGAIAGVILFFTALAAACGPLAMAAVADAWGNARYGFVLATGFAGLLALGLAVNWLKDPAAARLRARDAL
jgi:fucose permease